MAPRLALLTVNWTEPIDTKGELKFAQRIFDRAREYRNVFKLGELMNALVLERAP